MTRKAKQEPASETARMLAQPVSVVVKIASTSAECGREGGPFGDVLVEQHVRGSRFDVANRLRVLADVIAGTSGDPIESATIFVLYSRADKKVDR